MSKVQTLLKIISYQKEHPKATGAEMSSTVGITEQYLRKCKKEIKQLAFYFFGMLLERNETDLLLSKLDPHNGYERIILDKLQKVYLGEKDGRIEIASLEDKPSIEYLQVGLCIPKGDLAHIDFWLKYLLYDTLLQVDRDGKVEYKLAATCENFGGYSRWRVKMKKGLHWSDGKPITSDDIENTLVKNHLVSGIHEIKRNGRDEVIFILIQDNVLFPYWLSSISILPSHSLSLYNVTGGAFRMRKGSINSTSFYLYRNRDYYVTNQPKIDWIKLKVFRRSVFAIKSVINKGLDLFPLRSLQESYQWSHIPPQSFPFDGLKYYLLLVNKKRSYLKSEDNTCRLKESIDYNAINLCVSGVMPRKSEVFFRSRKEINLKLGYLADMPNSEITELAVFMSHCMGIQGSDLVDVGSYSPEVVREAVDVILTQIYFGYGYSRLERYFHSKGKYNILGFNYPEVDSLIDKLNVTVSMGERRVIGQEIVQKLQQENAIILLAPCFEYVLSNLHIIPSSKLNSLTDFIVNLPKIKVYRERFPL